jgi:hypothetical protein
MTDLEKAKNIIEILWNIIDDIDTASDMFKNNNQIYRNYVERKVQERFTTGVKTDGYSLLLPFDLKYSTKTTSSNNCLCQAIRIWNNFENDFHNEIEYSQKDANELVDQLNFAWQRQVNTTNESANLEEVYVTSTCGVGLDKASTPRTEKESENNQYKKQEEFIPNDFDEAVNFLFEQKIPINNPMFHFLGGISLRNNWGLWHNETAIAKWFTEKGLYHGDDRFGILQKAVESKINGANFDIHSEIKYYQDWWVNQYGEEYTVDKMKERFLENNI